MTEWPEKMEKDILAAREKIKEARLNLTKGVVEQKAKEAGKTIVEFSKDMLDKIEKTIEELYEKLSPHMKNFSDKAEDELENFMKEIMDVQKNVRKKRRELTGGHIEDKTVEIISAAEGKFRKIIDKVLK